jgi:pimeloyl-ACP methyl ester carboxylesterase
MRARSLAVAVAVLALAACTHDSQVTPGSSSQNTTGTGSGSDQGSTSTVTGDTVAGSGSTLTWEAFGSDGTVETSHLEVPIDHDDASKGTFDLYLARHLAKPDQRIGSLLVNPGGPGFGGTDFAIYADQIYSQTLLDHFDIVGFDPRGTGLSEPALDCVDDYDHFYTGVDITPDTPEERQEPIDLAKEFADDCATKNADILPYVGTNNAARDMNAIREALGESTISYFGFSYGSELGATWATLFPDTVRAAVLDGAADPNAGQLEAGLQQSLGFERALQTFLTQCSDDSTCAFHSDGDADGAFDALMASLDDSPIPTVTGRPPLDRAMALTAVAQAMYAPARWPDLAQGLADARGGDGAGLLALFDGYYERSADGTWPNYLEAFQVISCEDDPERPTVAEDDANAPKYRQVAPRMAPATIGSYFCTFFPPAADPRVAVTGKGAGPILVMGTTGDPATPIEATRNMAAALEDGRLVVVTAEGHTGYAPGTCSGDVVDAYLVDPVGKAPDDGYECK